MKYTVTFFVGVAVLCASYTCVAQRRFVRPVATPVVKQVVEQAQTQVEKVVAPASAPTVKQVVEKAKEQVEKVENVEKAEKVTPTTTTTIKQFPGADDQWKDSQDVKWIEKEAESHKVPAHYNNKSVLRSGQHDGHAYGRYTEADVRLWEAETMRLVMEGSRIFHDAERLGSTNGTSCDMCHPDGMGTHPETYPKYQVQLGRAALLRDMMNWCLQNPCRAEPMSGDDPRMRAMEAYIMATSSGKPMKYGKH